MARALHIVVSCTERKRVSAGPALRLRCVRASTVENRVEAWWTKLCARAPTALARDLYVGDHWATARDLPSAAIDMGFEARLWVASAGYGLVADDTELSPYSATFAPHSPDSVAPADYRDNVTWWRELARRPLMGRREPRSLRALVASAPRNSAILVVASSSYLRAMDDDLLEAADVAHTRATDLILVTGTRGPESDALRGLCVPTVAALRGPLGGALTSLHARVARLLVTTLRPTRFHLHEAQELVRRLATSSPKIETPTRHRGDDSTVRAYIRAALRHNPTETHTNLLRRYRASGAACEQKRFRALFRSEAAS